MRSGTLYYYLPLLLHFLAFSLFPGSLHFWKSTPGCIPFHSYACSYLVPMGNSFPIETSASCVHRFLSWKASSSSGTQQVQAPSKKRKRQEQAPSKKRKRQEQAVFSAFPSSINPNWRSYDVFLSFRGEDTRKNFVGHLYSALKQKGIRVFRDDKELERGHEISPKLVRAIEESRFSIIVFSENYADSTWCLSELVKIMDCTTSTGQIACPVFYKVDPSDVRNQKGSYALPFARYEKGLMEFGESKVSRWRAALSQAANLSGWDSRHKFEAELIKEIVEDIFKRSNQYTFSNLSDDSLVGMDFHLKQISSCLAMWSDEVKVVGIYGLGGVGKTTMATYVYNQIFNQFEGCSFLADVRENSQKRGLIYLQERLLNDIFKVSDLGISNEEQGICIIKSRLCYKNVLIVLDDVNHRDQLEKLAGDPSWFGLGSRIIITTRDEHLLDAHGVDEKYKVRELTEEKSLELFRRKAFKRKKPTDEFMKLSRDFVHYAQGLPLALKVLGSTLSGRPETYWKSELDRIKMNPHGEIIDSLRISYDALEQNEKRLFLDIACYFKGANKDDAIKVWDTCGFASNRIQILEERSLVTTSSGNRLLMHDLIEDMGRNIICQESPNNPGERSRLWDIKDIFHVLENKAGTEAVEIIAADRDTFAVRNSKEKKTITLSDEAFKKMHNLRILKLNADVEWECPQGLSNLPNNLRVLDWYNCPLSYLPSSYEPYKLLNLDLRCSSVGHLWQGTKVLNELRFVHLGCCSFLTEIPDFSLAPNLEKLILNGCDGLPELHPSVGVHKKLKFLSLRGCSNLTSLSCSTLEMHSLEYLDLSGCCKLKSFPLILGNMVNLKELYLMGTAIEELPSSISKLTGLKSLFVRRCTELKSLPNSIGELQYPVLPKA